MVGKQTLPIKNAAEASLMQLQCVPERCQEGQSSSRVLNCSLYTLTSLAEVAVMVVARSTNSTKRTPLFVPERRSHTLSDEEDVLELIWFIRGMKMLSLFGLLLCFFIFVISPCLVLRHNFA